jgi:hypothetical protein
MEQSEKKLYAGFGAAFGLLGAGMFWYFVGGWELTAVVLMLFGDNLSQRSQRP